LLHLYKTGQHKQRERFISAHITFVLLCGNVSAHILRTITLRGRRSDFNQAPQTNFTNTYCFNIGAGVYFVVFVVNRGGKRSLHIQSLFDRSLGRFASAGDTPEKKRESTVELVECFKREDGSRARGLCRYMQAAREHGMEYEDSLLCLPCARSSSLPRCWLAWCVVDLELCIIKIQRREEFYNKREGRHVFLHRARTARDLLQRCVILRHVAPDH
jgi:hypothetical protein